MFRCGDKKANWYLSRGLASLVSSEPPTIQLLFEPKGEGHCHDSYYLQNKLNKCVVCGSEEMESLTRHHVVPYCYRRAFPDDLKEHNYHDVVPLCWKCHDCYEDHADDLKEQLAVQYEAPINGRGSNVDVGLMRVRQFAHTLFRHGDRIPEPRRSEMYQPIKDYLGKSEVSKEDLQPLMELEFYDDSFYTRHGEIVVEKVGAAGLQPFVEMWRKHFLSTMNPKFMPAEWDVLREVGT